MITYYGGGDIPVFLLSVFSKGERANLSAAQKSDLKAVLMALASNYRKGIRG